MFLPHTTQHIKELFPIFKHNINGTPLIYLDNAATTQKPQSVIDAIHRYYTQMNANVYRASHSLANTTTHAIENVRSKVQYMLNAPSPKDIIFTSGTTASLNLVASSYARLHLSEKDEVLISRLEHHSGILPWQAICTTQGAVLREMPITQQGTIDIDKLPSTFSSRTKIVAVSYASNLLGTIAPLKKIIRLARKHKAIVVIDAAQAVAHQKIDVQDLDCDFLAFSSHKMYGPTGIGVLYGKTHLLQTMPPYQLGGGMVQKVTLNHAVYEDIPHRLEAGTPHIAGIIGLGAAVDFLHTIRFQRLQKHEQKLLDYAQVQLTKLPHIHLLPSSKPKVGIISFIVKNIHHLDVGIRLNLSGIAVRTGHHCAYPLVSHLNLPNEGAVRISLAIYNTKKDIDLLVQALKKLQK